MKKTLMVCSAIQLFLLKAGVFAEDAAQVADPREQSMMQTFIMIGIALLFFYLILWRPEQKRRKEMEEQRSSLKKGDKVTAMGIVGTIDSIEENTVILRMVDGSKIEMLKAAVNEVIPPAKKEEAK